MKENQECTSGDYYLFLEFDIIKLKYSIHHDLIFASLRLRNHGGVTYCNKGRYNRSSRPAVRPAKIYLARPLPAALLCLHWLPV